MENMGIENLFDSIYKKRRVLITGHTGFKGSWLTLWLKMLEADIAGYALAPNTDPSHFNILNLGIKLCFADINDKTKLDALFTEFQPEIVFHLAAQPIVIDSYRDALYTYQTNVIGTANVLECCRSSPNTKAIVVITTDKVYENKEWHWGYRENDRLGGLDPYSSSKSCVEILCHSYRHSFFKNSILLATARAGNVIGGGDWANYRLIPDIVRSVFATKKITLRNPN